MMVPTTVEGYAALQKARAVASRLGVRTRDAPAPRRPPAAPARDRAAPAPQGGYTVRAGDTLSGLAAQSGVAARTSPR